MSAGAGPCRNIFREPARHDEGSRGISACRCNACGLERLEHTLRLLRCRTGSRLEAAEAVIEAAPALVMVHALRAWLQLGATHVAPARESLAAALAPPHDTREAMHLRANGQFCAGR